VRQLQSGDFFGEVALLYNCHRTATVRSNNYGLYGKITKEDTTKLFKMHPILQNRMESLAMVRYDDSLRLFLMQALRRVDYFEDAPDDMMTDIAFNMKSESLEKGSTIFNIEDISTVLIVVFTGLVEIISLMDNGTEFPIERLGRGSVINPHSFLIEDKLDAIARCGVTS